MYYNRVLIDTIEREKSEKAFVSTVEDKKVLSDMLLEINHIFGKDFHYFAELDVFYIKGAGNIVRKYIELFPSEVPKAVLLRQMYLDKINECDKLILELYLSFRKKRDSFLVDQDNILAYVSVCYDNAFWKMKSKRIQNSLFELLKEPLDAYFLPLTMEMLTRKIPDLMQGILINYIKNPVSSERINSRIKRGLRNDYIDEQIKYNSIDSLKHIMSDEAIAILEEIILTGEKKYKDLAQKSYKCIRKKMKQQ